jgi:hypothetical protein
MCEEFSGGCDESDFVGFFGFDEVVFEGFQDRVSAAGDEGGKVGV